MALQQRPDMNCFIFKTKFLQSNGIDDVRHRMINNFNENWTKSDNSSGNNCATDAPRANEYSEVMPQVMSEGNIFTNVI